MKNIITFLILNLFFSACDISTKLKNEKSIEETSLKLSEKENIFNLIEEHKDKSVFLDFWLDMKESEFYKVAEYLRSNGKLAKSKENTDYNYYFVLQDASANEIKNLARLHPIFENNELKKLELNFDLSYRPLTYNSDIYIANRYLKGPAPLTTRTFSKCDLDCTDSSFYVPNTKNIIQLYEEKYGKPHKTYEIQDCSFSKFVKGQNGYLTTIKVRNFTDTLNNFYEFTFNNNIILMNEGIQNIWATTYKVKYVESSSVNKYFWDGVDVKKKGKYVNSFDIIYTTIAYRKKHEQEEKNKLHLIEIGKKKKILKSKDLLKKDI